MNAPASYHEALRTAGGLNPYGEPRFRLQWGEDLVRRKNCSDELVAHRKVKCWILCEWRPAADYPPHSWPEELPYPASGRYEIVQMFREEGNPVQLDTAALNVAVLLGMARVAMEYRAKTEEQNQKETLRLLQNGRERESQAQQDRIEDCLRDAMPAFAGVASYARNHGTRTAVQKKVEQIERNIASGMPTLENARGRGMIAPGQY